METSPTVRLGFVPSHRFEFTPWCRKMRDDSLAALAPGERHRGARAAVGRGAEAGRIRGWLHPRRRSLESGRGRRRLGVLPPRRFQAAIARGVAKINIFTHLALAAAKRMAESGSADASYFGITGAGRAAFEDECVRFLDVFGASGRA
jgi:hypothetical protein